MSTTTPHSSEQAHRLIDSIADLLCCPTCSGPLKSDESGLNCRQCAQQFRITDNIPQLFLPVDWDPSKRDVTQEMRSFYEATPFPNYDEFDSIGSLVDKARRRVFAKMLDDQIPFGARILECGCGTGQLTNFLSVANRTAIGTDMCLNSLRLANGFRNKNRLSRSHFFQMNLFRPCFKPGSFDLVISNGVLHHTSDPFLGFRSIARLVKPNGYIIIGLYHKWGRISTDVRRRIFHLTGDRFRFLDVRLKEPISQARKTAWFMDQYKNPHESKHTVREVLRWLNQSGFSFVKSIPKVSLFARFNNYERLFVQDEVGNRLSMSVAELAMSLNASRDGGLFIVIARKSDRSSVN